MTSFFVVWSARWSASSAWASTTSTFIGKRRGASISNDVRLENDDEPFIGFAFCPLLRMRSSFVRGKAERKA